MTEPNTRIPCPDGIEGCIVMHYAELDTPIFNRVNQFAPNTDILDEQIHEILEKFVYSFTHLDDPMDLKTAKQQLKTLFTEHSKQQVDEALRIAKGRVKTASYQQMTDSSIDWAFATNEKPLEENNQTYGKHTIPNDWEKLDGVWIWFEAFHKGVHWQGIQGFVYKRPDGTFIAPFRGKLLEVIHDTKNEYREVAQLSKRNKG